MRPSNLLGLTFNLLSTFVLAQNFSEISMTVQSADFNLVVQSRNKTLDGKLLGACHDGAAHEGLCIVGGANGNFNYTPSYVNFQFNTTKYVCTETNKTGTFTVPCSNTPIDPTLETGIITWFLYFSGSAEFSRVSQAMTLEYYDNSNVALAQINFASGGNYATQVAFDKNGLMSILSYQDDTLEPGRESVYPVPLVLYRWYICQTYVSSSFVYSSDEANWLELVLGVPLYCFDVGDGEAFSSESDMPEGQREESVGLRLENWF